MAEPDRTPSPAAARSWLFTYGLLREAAAMQRLLGAVPPGGVAGQLRGYARRTSPNGYFYLAPDPAAPPVPGVLWQVTDAELRVLDAFEDTDPADPTSPAGEYYRARHQAETAGGVVACWVYLGGTPLLGGGPSSPRRA